MTNSQPTQREEFKCACVHTDAYECARIRDRRSEGFDKDSEYHRRACECSCHYDIYEDDEDL